MTRLSERVVNVESQVDCSVGREEAQSVCDAAAPDFSLGHSIAILGRGLVIDEEFGALGRALRVRHDIDAETHGRGGPREGYLDLALVPGLQRRGDIGSKRLVLQRAYHRAPEACLLLDGGVHELLQRRVPRDLARQRLRGGGRHSRPAPADAAALDGVEEVLGRVAAASVDLDLAQQGCPIAVAPRRPGSVRPHLHPVLALVRGLVDMRGDRRASRSRASAGRGAGQFKKRRALAARKPWLLPYAVPGVHSMATTHQHCLILWGGFLWVQAKSKKERGANRAVLRQDIGMITVLLQVQFMFSPQC